MNSDDYPGAIDWPAGSPPSTLREACRRAGLDRGGARCPDCPVRQLCESELRWLVNPTLSPAPRYRH